MLQGGKALTEVKTDDLRELLRAVVREELPCPITPIGLATVGLLRLGDDLGHLRGLDVRSTKAVLVAVLAERGPR